MTIANWLSPEVLRPLAWALLHFLWQGMALAALAALLMAWSRRASTRYAVAVSVLAVMLAAPVVTAFYFYTNEHQAVNFSAAKVTMLPVAVAQVRATLTSVPVSAASRMKSSDYMPWLVEAWLIGVALLSLRSAGGFLLLERQRRRQSLPIGGELLEICRSLQSRLGLDRAIRYCECTWLQAPAVIGWFRPVVLLPLTALSGLSEEQLQSVIAHELAHIKRLDAFVNVFQVVVETLLFYHPAVWWLNRRIRAERENCCDDVAVSLCGNAVEYARALTLMEEWRSAPALMMAANRGPLSERIFRLLGIKSMNNGTRGIGVSGGVVCLTAALVAGNALAGMAHPRIKPALSAIMQSPMGFMHGITVESERQSSAHPSPSPHPVASERERPAAKPSPVVKATPAPEAMASAEAVPSEQASPAPHAEAAPSAQATPAEHATPAPKAEAAAKAVPATSYIDSMKAAGYDNLSIDQVIALKTQGVTAEYIRQMHDAGLRPEVNALIALRAQNVTPEYVSEMKGLGFENDVNKLIALKVQGVSADYAQRMKAAGIPADINQLIALKVQGASPDYVRDMRAAGLTIDTNHLIAMRVQGITPEYVRDMRAAGLTIDTNRLIALRVQGVTPEYVRDMRAAGLTIDTDHLIAMRVQGVTPQYVKSMHEAGLDPNTDNLIAFAVQGISPDYIRDIHATGFKPTIHEFVAMKVQGVTADYIKELIKAGFKVNIDQVIRAKVSGITPEFINQAAKHGFQNLSIDKLIQLKNIGVLDSNI